MGQSLTNILVHLILATKDRKAFIHENIESDLYRYLISICNDRKSPVLQIGGFTDHIHIFTALNPTISISRFISDLKAHSSRWIKAKDPHCQDFMWQKGYSAYSVSYNERHKAIAYIKNQKEHHKTISFREEYLTFLKGNQINFDENYLWD